MKRPFIRYLISIIAILLFLAGVVSLAVAIQNYNDSQVLTSTQTVSSRLDVALVNEDLAVETEDGVFNLGASYIKNIERDDSQNWSVVSRGAAEAGLANGTYQLMIVIPSDFSAKVMDIDSFTAEPATVTYQVNASGSQKIEAEANKVGASVVSDLNSQLVNLYMASVLANLYTAQQNVQLMMDKQETNISAYRANLLDSATGFQSFFPSIVSSASSNLEANKSLVEALQSAYETQAALEKAQAESTKQLTSLFERKAQDSVTDEAFSASLLEMDPNHLKANLEGIKSYVTTAQGQIQGLITDYNKPSETASSSTSTSSSSSESSASSEVSLSEEEALAEARLDKEITNLEERIKDLEGIIKGQETSLKAQQSDIEAFAKKKAKSYYGDANRVTLADLLKNSELEPLLLVTLDDYQASVDNLIQVAINQLPTINPADLATLEADMTLVDTDGADQLAGFNTTIASSHYQAPSNTLWADLAYAKYNLESLGVVSTPTPSTTSAGQEVTITMTTDDPDMVVTTWTYDGKDHVNGDKVVLKTNASFDINYTYKSSSPIRIGRTETSGIITVEIDGLAKGTVSADTAAYQEALVAYTKQVEAINSAYAHAQSLLEAYYLHDETGSLIYDDGGNLVTQTDAFFNQDVTAILEKILIDGITDYLSENAKVFIDNQKTLKDQLKNLKGNKESLAQELVTIKQTVSDLSSQVDSQLTDLDKLQTQLDQTPDNQEDKSSGLEDPATAESLSSLVNSSSSLSESSEVGVSQSTYVNELFESFNKSVEQAQENSNKLASDAQSLMTDFDTELAETGDFVTAFAKVFNNAYSEGVPNETLLQFLSNPVLLSSSSMQEAINSYRPFTWILLLEMSSLFTAYVFATHNLLKKVRDKFDQKKRFEGDYLNVLVITLLALVIGLVIGSFAASRLMIDNPLVPAWVLVVTLASILLTQGQYFLVRNFRSIGMGVAFYVIISFVYLSNALGTAASMQGLPAMLRRTNLLSLLEADLGGYFDGQHSRLLTIGLYLIAIVVVMSLNLFVSQDNLKAIYQELKALKTAKFKKRKE